MNNGYDVEHSQRKVIKCKHGYFDKCFMCSSSYNMCSKMLSKASGLKVGHLNVRSLQPKLDEIDFLIKKTKLDILCISETWLKKRVKDKDISIKGYTLRRKDRPRIRGGGVCIYIKDTIPFIDRPDLTDFNDVEGLWIELVAKNNDNTLICCMYRQPKATDVYYSKMLDMLEKASMETKEMIILGDLNYDYKIDESLSNNPLHYLESLYLLTQLIEKPTRVTRKSSKLIDVILTSCPEKHKFSNVAQIALSDHFLVYTCVDLNVRSREHKVVSFRDYKNFNADLFQADLAQSTVLNNAYFKESDTIDMWIEWKNEFMRICDKHAPFKEIRVKERYNPWITSDIIKQMYKRDYISEKANLANDPDMEREYRMLRNNVTNMIEQSKADYFDNVAIKHSNDPKGLWKEVHKIAGKDKHVNNVHPNLNCNGFNEFFANVGPKISASFKKDPLNWRNPKCIYQFKLECVSEENVLKHLSSLNESKLDVLNFDAKLLGIGASVIYKSLTKVMNMSIITGQIPDDWKTAKITPIYKGKGCHMTMGNYRPISVIGHIAKIMEKEVQKQFLDYMLKHDLINVNQFAYLKCHSTQTCLHRMIDEWYEALNENEIVAACFLDISKCFDTIDHELLIKKFEYYGVSGNELRWFKSYMTNRSHVVHCHGETSDKLFVKTGVPQGSVLGPIMFLLFINDISQSIVDAFINMFADDAALYVTGSDFNEVKTSLQKNVNNVHGWYTTNRLALNVPKTNVMLITNSNRLNDNRKLDICIEEQLLEQVKSSCYLGVHVDENLTWNVHVRNLTRVLSYKLYTLSKASKFMNSTLLNTIYLRSIQPCLDYACSVWGNCSEGSKFSLLRLQKRAARIVLKNFDYDNYSGIELIKSLKWQSLEQRRDYYLATQMYKCVHGLAPKLLCDMIDMTSDVNERVTRNSMSLNVYVPKPNVECYRKSFKYAGGKVWNGIPNHMQSIPSVNAFKYAYKKLYFKGKITL